LPAYRVIVFLVVATAAMTAVMATAEARAGTDMVLDIPYRSQYEGTDWDGSNCGPASIGMVLEAYSRRLTVESLRKRANCLLGLADPEQGTAIEHLARIVRGEGLATVGPTGSSGLIRWEIDSVRSEIAEGRPLVAQLRFALLPNHRDSGAAFDHYIVIVGVSGEDFIYNDPAGSYQSGYRLRMTAAQLEEAWGASHRPFTAFSVGPASGGATPPPVEECYIPRAALSIEKRAGSSSGLSDLSSLDIHLIYILYGYDE
jgi:hypothetical protein